MKVTLLASLHDSSPVRHVMLWAPFSNTIDFVVRVDHVRGKIKRDFEILVAAEADILDDVTLTPKLSAAKGRAGGEQVAQNSKPGPASTPAARPCAQIKRVATILAIDDAQSSEESFAWAERVECRLRSTWRARKLRIRVSPQVSPGARDDKPNSSPNERETKTASTTDPFADEVSLFVVPAWQWGLASILSFAALLGYILFTPQFAGLSALGDAWRVVLGLSQSALFLAAVAFIAREFNPHGLPFHGLAHRPWRPVLAILLMVVVLTAKLCLTTEVYNATDAPLELCWKASDAPNGAPPNRVVLPRHAWQTVPTWNGFANATPARCNPIATDGPLKRDAFVGAPMWFDRIANLNNLDREIIRCVQVSDRVTHEELLDLETCTVKAKLRDGMPWTENYIGWAGGSESWRPRHLDASGYPEPLRGEPEQTPARSARLARISIIAAGEVFDGNWAWIPSEQDQSQSARAGGLKSLSFRMDEIPRNEFMPLVCPSGAVEDTVGLELRVGRSTAALNLACETPAPLRAFRLDATLPITRTTLIAEGAVRSIYDAQQAPQNQAVAATDREPGVRGKADRLEIDLARVDQGKELSLTLHEHALGTLKTIVLRLSPSATVTLFPESLVHEQVGHRATLHLIPWTLGEQDVTGLASCKPAPLPGKKQRGEPVEGYRVERATTDAPTVWLPTMLLGHPDQICLKSGSEYTVAEKKGDLLKRPLRECPRASATCEPRIPPPGMTHCPNYCVEK